MFQSEMKWVMKTASPILNQTVGETEDRGRFGGAGREKWVSCPLKILDCSVWHVSSPETNSACLCADRRDY